MLYYGKTNTKRKNKMKNKLITIALSVLLTIVPNAIPANAGSNEVIAIIDTGFNTSLFKDKVIAEYCVVEYTTCPNGQTTMDGAGAATINFKTTNNTTNHGTQMLSVINKVNPSAKFVLVRIVAYLPNGTPYLYTNGAVKSALDWVAANQSKYGITVVNVSQGKIFANCGVPAGTAETIALLKSKNVAVIASAGNDSNKTAMNSISCLPDVISVGATDNPGPAFSGLAYDQNAAPTIAKYSNGSKPSFYANGRWYVINIDGSTKFTVGTSVAAASVSALWSLKNNGSWADTYKNLLQNAKLATDSQLSGPYIVIP